MKERNYKQNTRLIHTEYNRKDVHGALQMPIYQNVAFEFESAEEISLAFAGKKAGHMYSRTSNPTIEHLERKIMSITNAKGIIALASGMAAISNVVLALTQSGDNIVVSPNLFGNTYSLFESTFKPFGIECRWTDFTRLSEVENKIDEKTRLVFIETITNPQLEVADLLAVSSITKKHQVPLMIDTTLTPPCIFNAKQYGADIEIMSSTKYLSGGGTSVGGLIIDYGTGKWEKNPRLQKNFQLYGELALFTKLRKEIYRNMGACLSPLNAWLQSLGLETLSLRVDTSVSNTLQIAKILQNSKQVKEVNYPGITSSSFHNIAMKQFNNKPGSLLVFHLQNKENCFKFIDHLQLIRRSTNLCDNKTLVIHPASTIYTEFSESEKKLMQVPDTLIRLSVGIEDVEDLIIDIQEALNTI